VTQKPDAVGRPDPETRRQPVAVSRRGLLLGAGAFTGGALASRVVGAEAGASAGGSAEPAASPVDGPPASPSPFGVHQAGIARPHTPQSFGAITVFDLSEPGSRASIAATLTAVQHQIERATASPRSDRTTYPDGAGDLTVTIGLGPRVMTVLQPGGVGSTDLPLFAGDESIDPARVGGDLLVMAYSSDPIHIGTFLESLAQGLAAPGSAPLASLRHSQHVFRAPGTGTVARNPLGFHDGIVVPHGADLDENVWIPDGPAQGGTICVIRRLRLDLARFAGLTTPDREAVIGRQQNSGAPLSGGSRMDQADLGAKTPEGDFVVPVRSHVRAAHPSFTGSALMLRRGYAFDNGRTETGDLDAGLYFVCYQNGLDTFVKTQRRLDEHDDLMSYATATASATFLILPGFTPDKPLGASLLL
jgi:dye decolorizing peroxidase